MSEPARLSGFKVMRNVVRLALLHPERENAFPSLCTGLLCKEKLNLVFLTCAKESSGWALDMVLESRDANRVLDLLQLQYPQCRCDSSKTALLSLFPHKNKPEVTGALLDLLSRQHVLPEALAHSTSAISAVIPENRLSSVTRELFQTFRFSAYRTPEDWKLTQREKENLYKEVVASYQEKKPRVYGLDWQDNQELIWVRMFEHNVHSLAALFEGLAHARLSLIFLTSSPASAPESKNLFFCLPESQRCNYEPALADLPEAIVVRTPAVAHFSMNGPHFGDRYGIAMELFTALQEADVQLYALSCSIASIAGAVPARQISTAIESMRKHFDIPSVNKRD